MVANDRRHKPDSIYVALCYNGAHATPCKVFKLVKESENNWTYTSVIVSDSDGEKSKFRNCIVTTENLIIVALAFKFVIMDESLNTINDISMEKLDPCIGSIWSFSESVNKSDFLLAVSAPETS